MPEAFITTTILYSWARNQVTDLRDFSCFPPYPSYTLPPK